MVRVVLNSLLPEQRQDAAGSLMSNQPGDEVKRLHSDAQTLNSESLHTTDYRHMHTTFTDKKTSRPGL